LTASSLLGTAALGSWAYQQARADEDVMMPPRPKDPPKVVAVFLYPPADVVNAGQLEDHWRVHQWFTWPGNQFEPEAQHQKFAAKIREMATRLGIELQFAPEAIYQRAKVSEFIESTKNSGCDAVLVVNFWNTFASWSHEIATQAAPTAIVYQPVGSNHQLPPEFLRNAEGLFYIHSIENWAEIERGLRALRAKKMLEQSRLIRVFAQAKHGEPVVEPDLGVEVVHVPTAELIEIFDGIVPDESLVAAAAAFKKQAESVLDVSDEYLVEAMRAHRAVKILMQRYGADAITIECLMLKHRKPCLSFAIHNGELVPNGCENQLDGTLTMMLGRWLWDRGGFMHNPEFDTSENLYLAGHCTCAWKLWGPDGPSQRFVIRPFFHQLPKTAALEVIWPPGEPVVLTKYYSGKKTLCGWVGKVVHSPSCPPVGGCATRVLVEFDQVKDVCEVYPGVHPILFCSDKGDARCLKVFAKMYRMQLVGNV